MAKQIKQTFQYVANSNAAPFLPDTSSGFIIATDPMAALEKLVKTYNNPAGLFVAEIRAPTPKNPVLARYLSAGAATLEAAPHGLTEWRQNELYVDDKRIPNKTERYELVKRK